MAQFGVVYPLWSFAGEKDERLARLIGEVGIDHITVPVITGPVTQFRLEPETGPHYFHTEGGWHYQPEKSLYGGTDLHPRTAEWLKKSNPLPKLAELARRHRVAVHFRFDVRGWLADAFPTSEAIVRNPWDEPMPCAGACIQQPGYRSLLRGAFEDMLSYQPDGFELMNYSCTRWVTDDEFAHGGLRFTHSLGLGLCYCGACREVAENAGIDWHGLLRLAQLEVAAIAAWPPSSLEKDLLNRHVAACAASAAEYMAGLTERLQLSRLRLLATMSEWVRPFPPDSPWRPLSILAWNDSWRRYKVGESREFLLDKNSDAKAVSAWRPFFEQSSDLVRFVTASVADGASMIEFEDVDAAPKEVVSWLKQAVRFARRLGVDA